MKKNQKKSVKKVSKSAKKIVTVKKAAPKPAPLASKPPKTERAPQKGIIPLGDRILLKPFRPGEAETKNNFGIIIPETVSKEQPEQGTVLAVGEGRLENGKRIPLQVQVGDVVIFSKYAFDEVKNDGQELYILKEDNILAIIRK